MTEEHGTYDHADATEASVGIARIGDILRRVIDERGWPLAVGPRQRNGDSHDDEASCDA